jgi:hypothetical protein
VGPPLDLLITTLEQVDRLQMFVMLRRQPVEGHRVFDMLLDPAAQLRVGGLPLGEPSREVPPGLGEVAPVVQPAQLAQAIVVHLARHVVQGLPKEVDVAAPPSRLSQDLDDRPPEAGMVVGHHELDA